MTDYKSLLTSRTVIGLFVSILILIFKNLDIDLGDQEMLVADIVQLISILFAVYGRITATKKIVL